MRGDTGSESVACGTVDLQNHSRRNKFGLHLLTPLHKCARACDRDPGNGLSIPTNDKRVRMRKGVKNSCTMLMLQASRRMSRSQPS